MVRKNDASTVQTQTALAYEKLSTAAPSEPPSTATVKASLDMVCKLTGIGPATGTLLLNVFDPVHIPFFQDEMFTWFFPETKADKLKYTQKEYLQLFERARLVLKVLGVKAVDLEKVSYVVGHIELLEGSERKALDEESFQSETDKKTDRTVDEEVKQSPPAEPWRAKRGTKRALSLEVDEKPPQTSTRRTQRKRT